MKRLLFVLLAFGLLMSLNVSQGITASAEPSKQVLRIGYEIVPVLLDPAAASDNSTSTVVKGLFEGLVRLNEAGQAVPGMAKGWKISNDGKTYTFTLRSSAKWSNGQQVKASDFEYAWKKALSPDAENTSVFKLFIIANAEAYHNGKFKNASKVGVKSLNNSTLQVTLAEKSPYFLQLLAENIYMPVNASVAQTDEEWAYDIKTMVTNGPFKLKLWEDEKIILSKNPNYYAPQDIHFSQVQILSPQAGTASTTEAYANHEVDWVGGKEALDYESIDLESVKDLSESPIGGTYYYQINLNKAPFDNLKIRKALAMAIDREELGYGTPAFGFIPWGVPGTKLDYRAEIKDTAYFNEDAKGAKQLLQEGLKEEGLTKLPDFSIIVNEGPGHEKNAESVISSWKKNLDVEATLEVQDWETLLDNRSTQNYTIARAGWVGDYNDPESYMELFTSWSSDNDTGWANKQYDSYIKQARQTLDPHNRMQLYAKAEKILIDDMCIIPLYYYQADVLHRPNINNVYLEYDGTIAFTRGYLH